MIGNLKRNLLIIAMVLGLISGLEGLQLKYVGDIEFADELFISKVVATDDGIFVKAVGDWPIVQCDWDGKIMRKFGRIGEGPGEFQFLSDFSVGDDGVVGVGDRKLCKYELSGALDQERKSKLRIYKVIAAQDNTLYLAWKKIIDPKKKLAQNFYHLLDSQNRLLLEIPDESRQPAFMPARGQVTWFPWFPSPFFNRPVIVPGLNGDAAVFMTRERSFRLIKKDGTVKTLTIDAPLKVPPITTQDKENFFECIQPKPVEKTKQSVDFPETMELFLGVIRWGDGWALLHQDSLTILSYDGKFRERIQLPRQFAANETWQKVRLENYLSRHQNKLYVINNNESISVFQLE